MNQTRTIHSVDTGLIYAVLKLLFSKQTKNSVLFLYLCHSPMINSMKTNFAQQQSIVATPAVNHTK